MEDTFSVRIAGGDPGANWRSPEHAEAVRAFVEKRPPVFPPRR
jgi:hypothetical protein